MRQKVITGIRPSQEGPNYQAVHESMKRSEGQSPSCFRTTESVKSEQEIEQHAHRFPARVRKQRTRSQSEQLRVTGRGVFYVLATVALIVFVKVMIGKAGPGAVIEVPPNGSRVIRGG